MRDLEKDLQDFRMAESLSECVSRAMEILPEAVRRALAAEAKMERLIERVHALDDGSFPGDLSEKDEAVYLRGYGDAINDVVDLLKAGDRT